MNGGRKVDHVSYSFTTGRGSSADQSLLIEVRIFGSQTFHSRLSNGVIGFSLASYQFIAYFRRRRRTYEWSGLVETLFVPYISTCVSAGFSSSFIFNALRHERKMGKKKVGSAKGSQLITIRRITGAMAATTTSSSPYLSYSDEYSKINFWK